MLEAALSLSASGSQTRLREECLLKRLGLVLTPSLIATAVFAIVVQPKPQPTSPQTHRIDRRFDLLLAEVSSLSLKDTPGLLGFAVAIEQAERG